MQGESLGIKAFSQKVPWAARVTAASDAVKKTERILITRGADAANRPICFKKRVNLGLLLVDAFQLNLAKMIVVSMSTYMHAINK